MRRFGSPYRDLADRLFYNSFESEDGCWLWLGRKSADGYGRITLWLPGQNRRRVLQAHRVAYEVLFGLIPFEHDLDHKCQNRACIHPNHLVPKYWIDHRRETRFGRTNPPSQLALDLS